MKKYNFLIILLIIVLMMQNSVFAAFWSKDKNLELGNEIVKEEYPESKDVEPKLQTEEEKVLLTNFAGGEDKLYYSSVENMNNNVGGVVTRCRSASVT